MATNRPQLNVEKRELTGCKVKNLRKEGILPASVYGKKVKSVSVQGDIKDVVKTLDRAGETGLVDLVIKGAKEPKAVLLKNPQYDPITDELIHIDFHQVDLTEKVRAHVPIEVTGESPAVEKGEGLLVHVMNEIEIEALPTDLVDRFVVDISKLTKIDDAITVADLDVDKNKITLHAEEEQVVVKVEEPKEEEEPVVPETPAEGEEALAEGGEGAPTEGAAKEGEKKPETEEEQEAGEEKKEADKE